MKKLVLSSTLLTLLFFTNVYGKAQKYEYSGSTQDTAQMKFGAKLKPHFATSMVKDKEGTLDNLIFRPSFDLFGEYAFNDAVGVQLSLGYSGQGEKVVIGPKFKSEGYCNYIMLSVMPRFYPGSDRQFCLFIGPRVSWLASAKVQLFEDGKKSGEAFDLLGDKLPKEKQPKRVDWGILWGLDYESDAGIILGVDWNIGITNFSKDESNHGMTFSSGFTLGYNFAKLFN